MRHSTLSSRIVKAHGLSTEKMQEILQGYEAALRVANRLDEEYDDFTEGEQTDHYLSLSRKTPSPAYKELARSCTPLRDYEKLTMVRRAVHCYPLTCELC